MSDQKQLDRSLAAFPVDSAPARAMVIHCADPRFQVAMRRFVIETLGLGNYLPIVEGGGIHALRAQEYSPREFETLWHQVTFMLNLFKLPEVILIGHQDCRWYQNHAEHFDGVEPESRCRLDLPIVAGMLISKLPHLRVRCYWAGIENDKVVFTEVIAR